jgi:hypothetical protein
VIGRKGMHPDLVQVVERAIRITTRGFGAQESLRTREHQAEPVARRLLGGGQQPPRIVISINAWDGLLDLFDQDCRVVRLHDLP